MSDETSLVRVEPTPMQLLSQAMAGGMSVKDLGELVALARQAKIDKAAEDFAQAMTDFQARCPVIVKDRTATIPGRDGKAGFQYKYSGLDDIMKQIRPILAETGLVVTFTTRPIVVSDKALTTSIDCTCRIRKGTHFEETNVSVPIPAAVVNDAQRMGQAISYAKRYSLCAALNIVVTDEDDDAQGLLDTISEAQVEEIKAMSKAKGKTDKAMQNWLGVAKLGDISQRDFPRVIDYLRRQPDVKVKEEAK